MIQYIPMLGISTITKLFDTNEHALNKIRPLVVSINNLEPEMKKLKKADFSQKTGEFKNRLADGETLDTILPQAYALVREAAYRAIGERPYDVQLMSAIVLHQGNVSEQRTGEGKTLSASLPLYLNSLTGRGVHLVTVNDYLARVGAGWMGPICDLLGMTVAAMIHDQSYIYDPTYQDEQAIDWRLRFLRPISRKEAYNADITYGINSEFGFDYLRDNMVSDLTRRVQRSLHYAIVDEVDSVLIDEARTPHIISAPDTEPTNKYFEYSKIVGMLKKDHYEIDEKMRTAHLTEDGVLEVERILNRPNLYQEDFQTLHHIEAALRARTLFQKDKQYIVQNGEVIIVDEFTGRLLKGRRFSEGLHQAIEAKEGVTVQKESKTLATVSLQNYFRMYEKLAGMTGTAATEGEEFHKIYNLDVVVIPTHQRVIRDDRQDLIYKTMQGKYAAVAKEIAEVHRSTGQPILVGTTSIEQNEVIGAYLQKKGITHNLLNAKNHEREAQIIAEAGKKGAVTVATNMAGRGVDIILGGPSPNKYLIHDEKEFKKHYADWKKAHDEVVRIGGLYVIGTERHESRRIDNQLRGRAGRQGDPGVSRFFVSLEDDIMRIFGGAQIQALMTRFNMPEDQPLEHRMVSRAIEQAQIKVEGFHFDSRKHLVEYDDVLNTHRKLVYSLRERVLDPASDLRDIMIKRGMEPSEFDQKEKELGDEVMKQIVRWVSLQVIDRYWMDHLTSIEDMREGIGLRGYAQRDPLVEYKKEAFTMFERLVQNIDSEIVDKVERVQLKTREDESLEKTPIQQAAQNAVYQASGTMTTSITQSRSSQHSQNKPVISDKKRIGRNDPCPCGAINPQTKKPYKYKKCGLISAPYHKV